MKEQWKVEYCKKFGLCSNNRPNCTCQCTKELKFIEKLLAEQRKEAYQQGYDDCYDNYKPIY